MAKWFLRTANGAISQVTGLCLIVALLYAGYALWDNQQIYASADNGLRELAPSMEMTDDNKMSEETGTKSEKTRDTETTESEESKIQAGRLNQDNEPPKEAAVQQNAEETAEDAGTETELSKLFKQLKEINEDIGAWITMPGTAIDYPVVQGDNNIQYVSTDIYGNFAIVGSIFLDNRNREDYSDTYNLLYGHNMSEHRMFSDVNLYKDENFFNEHQKGYIYFPSGAHWLQTISITVTPASDSWILNPLSWTEIDGETMLEQVQASALYISETGMEAMKKKLDAGKMPKIVALSTCSNEFTDARTILLTLMDP